MLLVCAAVLACQQRQRRPSRPSELASAEPSVLPAPSGLAPQTAPSGSALPEALARELRLVHATKLKLAPPRAPLAGLALGRECLARATADGVEFLNLHDGALLATTAIGAPRATAVGPGGGLLALGASRGVRLGATERKPSTFESVSFFPGSLLLSDLEDPQRFYVFYAPRKAVVRYQIGQVLAGMLAMGDEYPLAGFADALTLTRDGAFVYLTDDGAIARVAPRGSRARFTPAAGRATAWRLLPAARFDEVWSVTEDGEVKRLVLAPGLPEKKRFRLDGAPFEAAANSDSLAFVTSAQPDGGARRWALLVVDFEGHERFRRELPAPEIGVGDGWFEQLVQSKQLALSDFVPLVAVGGRAGVELYDYRSGAQVFAR